MNAKYEKVFICSPYRGDVKKHVEQARYYSRMAAVCGYCPVTPHLFFPQFLKDDDPQERIKAIKLGIELMKSATRFGYMALTSALAWPMNWKLRNPSDFRSSSTTNTQTEFSRIP